MRAVSNEKNLRCDKWLAALVDAMDEVESLRADDFCRSTYVPAGLMAQLASAAGRVPQIAASRFAFA
jgi:hypothetical protein